MSGAVRGDVLIVKTSDLTSFVQALPALKAIRLHHRGARIVLLTAPPLDALARDVPYFDEVDASGSPEDARALARLAHSLKRERFTRVYDFETSPASDRLLQAVRPGAPEWVGFQRGASIRLDPATAAGLAPVDAAIALIGLAGVPAPDIAEPNAAWAETARRGAPSLKPAYFGLAEPYVLLAPAAAAEFGPPRWSAARFAGLAARLTSQGIQVAVVSETQDRAEARAVVHACADVKDIGARADLTQTAALAGSAAALVGHGDLGVVHLCAAAGAPTLAISATTDDVFRTGVRAKAVVHFATPKVGDLSVEDVADALAMFLKVGRRLDRRVEV